LALTNWITGIGLTLSCLSGDIGILLMFAVLWFPIAGVIKQQMIAYRTANAYINNNTHYIPVKDGESIRVWTGGDDAASSADMAVGMSMGNP